MGKLNNIPISMDDELLARIDAVATARGSSRSWVIREAIRGGLSAVEASSTPELFFPDPDLRADVGNVAEWKGFTRAKVLLEAVKIGLPAVAVRFRDKDSAAASQEGLEGLLERLDPRAFPLLEDLARARREAAWERCFRETLSRACPQCEDAIQRVELVLQWARQQGKPLPSVYAGKGWVVNGWIPKETLESWWLEMMGCEAGNLIPSAAAPATKAASAETAERPRAKTGTGRSGRQR